MRRMLICGLLVAGVCMAFGARVSIGAWAPAGPETRIIEADVIVVGKIVQVKDGPTREKRAYSIGQIQIDGVLKGKVDAPSVDLIFPARAIASGEMVYKSGDEGIWLLRQDAESDSYLAPGPYDRLPANQKDGVGKILELVQHLHWGEPADGLRMLCKGQIVADADPGAPRGGKAAGVPALAFFLRNDSDKPVCVCDYAGDRPIRISIIGPDGKDLKPDPYMVTWRQPITKASFIVLRPGQVRAVGGTGGSYKLGMFSQPGQYKISATFTATRDGKAYKLDNVWTGHVTSNVQEVNFALQHN